MKIRIGHLSTFYHTAILLMAGYPGRRVPAFEAEWRLFGTGPAIMDAFEKGELDIAYVGLPPAVAGIARGVRVRCIAGGHVEGTVITGKSYYIGFPAIADLSRIFEQFKGAKIGVPGKGSIHDVILADCLRKYGLEGDIGVINFRWADLALEAMVKGEVSVVVGTPALAVAARRYAGGEVLYPPSRLWPDNPSYGIVAAAAFLEHNRGALLDFVSAHEEAAGFMRTAPYEAAGVISDFVGFVDRDFVMDTLSVSPKYCAQLTEGYMACTMAFVAAQKALGYIGRDVSREEIFDNTLIREIHGGGDHYGDGIGESAGRA
jgi:NitT/TauT family transport system substrate-binding protein